MLGAIARLACAARTPPKVGTPIAQRQGRRVRAAALAVVINALALGAGSAACAQDTAVDDAWRFSVSPYLWAAGLSGETGTLRPLPPADVDLSFSDILDDLRFAGMVAGTARNGRFGLAADIQYVETRSDGDLRPFYGNTRVTSKSFLTTLTGEYAAIDRPDATLFVGAGLRVWSVDTDLKLSQGGPTLGGGARPDRRVKDDDTWVDPVLTLRGEADLSERWFVAGWTAVGGFGVGSDFMADLFGSVGYRISDRTSVSVGYRWMTVDRDADGFLYDIDQQGPMAGMTFRF